jgi:error-prone DNA polymerase
VSYVELRAHTAFSFGDGSVTPEVLVERAGELGYTALGITDAADLGGAARFASAAQGAGVRPVVGAELAVGGRPAAFLARTAEGCRNLAGLVTRSRVGDLRQYDGEAAGRRRGRPGVTWAEVAERSDGLHALTGPSSGPVAALLGSGERARAERLLAEWRDVFGDRLAVEVQLHHAGGSEAALAGALIELAERVGVAWVVCHDPRYVDGESRLAHDVLTALRHGTDVDGAAARGALHPNGEWRLLSPAEMARRWAGRERGLEESARIAAECDFDLAWLRPPLPRFPVPAGESDDSFLRAQVEEGARTRWGEPGERERRQLDHELEIIRRLGFAGFFLVMWDAVRFAHRRNILCQGRGSAANSAVAYCLGITAVDPVANGLLFERFLSEVRVDGQADAPDIDVDIEHDRREEVLDYVYGQYRRSHSAITCTVQTYRAPNAVQDAMRAFGYPAELAVRVSKRLRDHEPAAGAARLREGLAKELGLAVDDGRGGALLRAIAAFDGLPRIRSTHVGGFVLSSAPLGDYLPIERTTMGRTIVQFDKDDLDRIGVPKFDFLGLGALSLVRRAFDAIELRTGERPCMYRLPVDDGKTYDLIARGETVGMFQIESRAQISSLVHTRPERLYDIVVQVALIRPGPIVAKFVRPYTRRRRGWERPTYLDPRLEPILARTQGIPIFQEQAMAIAMSLANYSGGQADELRRTMGNDRKRARLVAALQRLRAAMMAHGVDESVATRITEDLQSFANYGFPESHAWSFALIAYATGYLKAHYPTEFYLGLLNAWPMGFYPPSTLIHDARRHGVEVRPPCLAGGDWECTAEEGTDPLRPALRIGWRYVRGVGGRSLDCLKEARAAGPFRSIADVAERARLTRVDVINLARAGAFAWWEPDRRRAAWEGLHAVGDTLPLAPARQAPHAPRPLTEDELIFLDYFAAGMSIHGHPMQQARARLRTAGARTSRELAELRGGERVTVAGLVTVRQRPHTAKGTLFLLLEDEHGFINVIVPRTMVEANDRVVKHTRFIVVQGRFQRDGLEMNVVGERFRELEVGPLAHRSRDFR